MNLEQLSPDVKRNIARALWTKKEVKKHRHLELWEPWQCRHGGVHVGQLDPFKSQARRRLVFGGNRSGKSEVGAADVTHMFLGTHPYRENRMPMIIKVFAEDFSNAIKNTILPKLMKFIPKSSIAKVNKNEKGIIVKIEGVNGSIIDLMSYDQEIDKFESFDADMAWFDEPPPQEIYEAVRRGLIDRRGIELFTMTPLKEPWIYQNLYVPAFEGKLTSTDVFELQTLCNPHISEAEIKELEEVWDEETRKTRLQGKFRHLQGLIYPFDRSCHVVPYFDWPRDWPVYSCIDPHPKKPHAVTWMGITKGNQKVIIDELKQASTIKELAKSILQKEAQMKYRIVDRLIDTSIRAIDRVDQRKILSDAGINTRFPAKHDRVMPGIELVQQLLKQDVDNEGHITADLLVRSNCVGHIKEFMTYVWADTGDKPKKENDDYMDNVRYLCDSKPVFHYSRTPIRYAEGFGTYGS